MEDLTVEDLDWVVLDIRDDGMVDLIAEQYCSAMSYVGGRLGYNNFVYVIDNACNAIYKNPSIGATARSVKLEDFTSKINDNFNYKENNENNVKNLVGQYYYPSIWKDEIGDFNKIDGNYNNGILGQSEQYNLVTQSSDLITNNEISIEINDFTLNASTKYNMKAVRTAESDTDTNFYWDIFTNTNSSYFYTTRMTIEDESGIGFGITIGGSNTSPKRDSSIVYYTTGRNNVSVWTHIRPVVTLPESSIDTDIGSGIKGNEWGIKN